MARRSNICGSLLRDLRVEAGLTQEQMAFRVGISRETVSAIENDKPGTIDSIEAEVISRWHIASRQRMSADTRTKFFSHVMNYFGFSEQTVINMAKELSDPKSKD